MNLTRKANIEVVALSRRGNIDGTKKNATRHLLLDVGKTEINFTENIYAAGLRYRFNDKNSLSAQYQVYDIKHKNDLGINYGISQFNILYSLFF